MKKEKQVRSYKRRTKSGKIVTVKAHTAKYDAAEERAKEASKRPGAGKELEERKKKPVQLEVPFDKEEEKKVLDEVKDEEKKPSEKKTTKKVRPVGSGTNGPTPKEKKSAKKATKTSDSKSTSEPAFTAAEFKEWYRGTGSAADKKVAKALRAQLGRSGYRKLEDEAIDNYSSRGHLSMLKRVSSGSDAPTKKGTTKSSSKKSIKPTAVKTPSVPESLEKFGGSSLMVGDNASKAVQQLKDAGLKSFRSGVMTYYVHPDGKSVYAHDTEEGELRRRSTDRREFSRHDKTIDKILSSYGTPVTSSSRSMTTDYSRKSEPKSTTTKSASSKEPLIKDPFERAELINALKSKGKGHFNRVKMSSKYGEYFAKGSWNPSALGKALLKEEADSYKTSTRASVKKVKMPDKVREKKRRHEEYLRKVKESGMSIDEYNRLH